MSILSKESLFVFCFFLKTFLNYLTIQTECFRVKNSVSRIHTQIYMYIDSSRFYTVYAQILHVDLHNIDKPLPETPPSDYNLPQTSNESRIRHSADLILISIIQTYRLIESSRCLRTINLDYRD